MESILPEIPLWLQWLLVLATLVGIIQPLGKIISTLADWASKASALTAAARANSLTLIYIKHYIAHKDQTNLITLLGTYLARLIFAVFVVLAVLTISSIVKTIEEASNGDVAARIGFLNEFLRGALGTYFYVDALIWRRRIIELWAFDATHQSEKRRILDLWKKAGLSADELQQKEAKLPSLPEFKLP